MKTAEIKNASSTHHQPKAGQPFFQKEGESAFFSEAHTDAQAKPFFDVAHTPFAHGIHAIQPQLVDDSYGLEMATMVEDLIKPSVPDTIAKVDENVGTPAVQTKCAECERGEQVQQQEELEAEPEIQKKPVLESETEPLEKHIQTKLSSATNGLTIGQPDDQYEQEADVMADEVVQRLSSSVVEKNENLIQEKLISNHITPLLQRKCTACEEEEKMQMKEEEGESIEETLQKKPIFESNEPPSDDVIQRKCAECEKEEKLQKKEDVGRELIPGNSLESSLASLKGSGNALPDVSREQMESSFGMDFSQVRVHTDNNAVQMSKNLHAQAFTHGSDIYFNSGKYDTDSDEGKRLIAHELTHTVQQGPTIQMQESVSDAEEAGACPNYEANEVFNSRREPGILPNDVSSLPGDNLLVADIGVGRNNIRASSQAETLFQEKYNDFETNCAIHLKIHGFTDCSGPEDRNLTIREQRANNLKALIGPLAKPRISETTGAPIAETVATNGTKEDRAKNRSARISFREGFWLQKEAIDIAVAADTELQSALSELGTSSVAREKNIPEYMTHKSIMLEPLTPTHNALLTAVNMEFFTGKTDYLQTFTLPGDTRSKTYASNRKVAIQSRNLPCINVSLSRDQIKERILEAITMIVLLEAHGNSAFEQYRASFNARYHIAPYNTMSDALDLSLDSKGPRTQRSRNLFNTIYDELPVFKTEYDNNAGGIKEKVDTYYGPDSLNTINSPRLEALILVFNAAATPVPNPDYTTFKTQVTTAANNLDFEDTTAIDASQEWQALFINKLPDVTKRTEIKNIIDQGPSNRPVPPAPPAPIPPGPPPPSGTVSPDAQVFLDNIRINGPAAPITSNLNRQPVDLQPESDRPNPNLTFKTEFRLTPTNKVAGSPNSPKKAWPVGNQQGELFQPNIVVDGSASMTANLHLHDLPSGSGPASPIPPKAFNVNDNRLNHVKSVWNTNLWFLAAQFMDFYNLGDTVNYRNGGQNFQVKAALPTGQTNPGLNLTVNARVKRGASVIASIANPVDFPSGNRESGTIALNFLEPNSVPSGGDPITVEVDLLESGAVKDSKTISITIHATPIYTKSQAETAARNDKNYFTGTLIPAMRAAGGIQEQVAQAVSTSEANGGITLEPLGIRHDSVALIERLEGRKNPAKVAYFAGTTYTDMRFWRRSPGDYPHLIVAGPNAAGFSTGCCPDLGNNLIVLNRTFDVSSGGTRSDDSLKQLLIHEAVHRLDNRPNRDTPIERYKTEFRAYWMDGRYGDPNTPLCPNTPTSCTQTGNGCHDARYDESCSALGPKSPRARAIFMSLYGNDLYDFVKTNYDNNTNGFREKVDRYLFPDGINLRVSVRLERLRRLVEGFSGANFANLHTEVKRFMGIIPPPPSGGALDANDKTYISQSRAWRDLVESKVTNTSNQRSLKSTLGIPL